jgi:hypothetical protein
MLKVIIQKYQAFYLWHLDSLTVAVKKFTTNPRQKSLQFYVCSVYGAGYQTHHLTHARHMLYP